MPTYDYKCSKCDYFFDYFQSMSSDPLKECPKCKGELKRLIGTGAGTIFRGSGFYHTDYKNAPAAAPAKKEPVKTEPVKKDSGGASTSKPASENP